MAVNQIARSVEILNREHGCALLGGHRYGKQFSGRTVRLMLNKVENSFRWVETIPLHFVR
jgi:hypothetical protein